MTTFKEYIANECETIKQQWLRRVLDSYPNDASGFFAKEKDQFANPVGQTLHKGIHSVFDSLHQNQKTDLNEMRELLLPMMKIRAVQEFSAAKAVSFFLELKEILRKGLADALQNMDVVNALREFEDRIDQVTLIAFDAYMSCREQVCEIRINEVKRRVSRVLQKTGWIDDGPDLNPDRQQYPNQGGGR